MPLPWLQPAPWACPFATGVRVIMFVIVVVAVGLRLRATLRRLPCACSPAVGAASATVAVRIVRVGAARSGAAGMTVSWVVGTLGVGHDNLLNG